VPPVKERGTLKIPKEILPEANGGGIPIYVPEIGENYRAVDSGWRTLREINKTKLDFDWWKLIASYSTGGADTPEGSALAAITSLVEAAGRASSVLELKLLIQKGSGGNLRAIIEVGDPRGKHFLRTYAGQTIGIPNVQDNTIRAGFSKYITTAFHLEPDAFPNIYYMMSISIDRSHKDDEIIGYLSLPEVDKIALTPKLYSADEMAIVRLREIPPKREVVIEIIGSSLSNLWEGTLTGEESSNFSEMLSEMLTTPSVETHPSSNSLQSFMERVQGIINWIRGLFGFK